MTDGAENDGAGRPDVRRALRRRRRVARRAGPAPVRARRLRGHRLPLLDVLPGGAPLRRSVLQPAERDSRFGARRARRLVPGLRRVRGRERWVPRRVEHGTVPPRAARRGLDRGRLPRQRGRRYLFARAGARDVRSSTALRVRVRWQRRRVPHDRVLRERRRRVGRRGAVHPRHPAEHAEHVLGAGARVPCAPRQGAPDRRRARAGRERRHVRGPHPGGARRAGRGDAARVPDRRVVRRRARAAAVLDGVGRAVRPLRHVGPHLLRRLLDGARLPRRELRRRRSPRPRSSTRRRSPSSSTPRRRPSWACRSRWRCAAPDRPPTTSRSRTGSRTTPTPTSPAPCCTSRAARRPATTCGSPAGCGGYVSTGIGQEEVEHLRNVAVGDDVVVDNTPYLAFQTYHRHQVPDDETYEGWDAVPCRREAHLPAAPAADRPAFRPQQRCGPDERTLRRQDDRRPEPLRRDRVSPAGGVVPTAGRGRARRSVRRPVPRVVHRQRDARRSRGRAADGPAACRAAPTSSATAACSSRRSATSPRGPSAASRRRRAPPTSSSTARSSFRATAAARRGIQPVVHLTRREPSARTWPSEIPSPSRRWWTCRRAPGRSSLPSGTSRATATTRWRSRSPTRTCRTRR